MAMDQFLTDHGVVDVVHGLHVVVEFMFLEVDVSHLHHCKGTAVLAVVIVIDIACLQDLLSLGCEQLDLGVVEPAVVGREVLDCRLHLQVTSVVVPQ